MRSPSDSTPARTLGPAFAVAALVAVTLAVYWPGLDGPFVFDDYATLPALGALGGVDSPRELLRFLSTGITGPTGRPLALASFLLDDVGWPSDPRAFKHTSLMLHVLAGLLVLWLVFRLEHLVLGRGEAGAFAVAAAAAGFWLLCPLFTGTVLYVVQRMTILAAICVLAGLIAWTGARVRLPARPRAAYLQMSAALVLATGIGVLAKENAALLPLLVLVLEWLLLRPRAGRFGRLHPGWVGVFLVLPLAAGAAYLALNVGRYAEGYAVLGLGVWERLMTEARVLLEYAHQLLIPQFAAGGVFHDGYPASRSLLQPPFTLAAMLAIGAAGCVAVLGRGRWPRLAAAIGFFLAGHALESSVLPLELYFDHRNYLPAALLFWPLAGLLVRPRLPGRRWALAGIAVYALLFPAATTMQAAIWGASEDELMLYWATHNPDSPRAQRTAAMRLLDRGDAAAARALLARSLARDPAHHPTRLHLLLLSCRAGGFDRGVFEEGVALARREPFDFRAYALLRRFVGALAGGQCRGDVTAGAAARYLEALRANPAARAAPGAMAQVLHLQGYLALSGGRTGEAVAKFREALAVHPSVDIGLVQIGLLGGRGATREALAHLGRVRALVAAHTRSRAGLGPPELEAELDRLAATLRAEL